jgi:hypothetical protein
VNPLATEATHRVFGAGGLAGISGGVMFQGDAVFVREGTNPGRIDAASLSLLASQSGNIDLVSGTDRYSLSVHAGLACPLGQFVQRGGEIAFSIPPDTTSEAFARLQTAGAVRLDAYSNPVFAAREFATTQFVPLLEKADFADVVPLPEKLAASIIANINKASGTGVVSGEGSYVNTDAQTTYQAYLVDGQSGKGRVEVSGVPLRYSWVRRRDGSSGVFQVEAFSQSWAGLPSLTDFRRQEGATQYDVISAYQAAGLFRALRRANGPAFATFVESACRYRL